MFSLEHILYIIISLVVVGLLMFGVSFVHSQKWKNRILIIFALLCFFTHISIMYQTFFTNDTNYGNAYDNILFPIYFCNYMMYLLLAVSFIRNKESKIFKCIATFVAYGGIFGSLITLFVTPPGIAEWESFKSALSHTFMLMGCLYLFVGKYVRINVYNLIPYAEGLLSCGVVGGVVELIFFLCGKPSPNAMYLVHGPNELPEFKFWMFVIVMLALIFIFTCIWEYFARKKEQRWYKNIDDLSLYIPTSWFEKIKKGQMKKQLQIQNIDQNNASMLNNNTKNSNDNIE